MNSDRWLARIHPGALLTAALLRGLEEGADRGAHILDGARGLVHFDLDHSLTAMVEETFLAVEVRGEMAGIATRFHTVVLEEDDRLQARLPLQRPRLDFDLLIRVNPSSAQTRPAASGEPADDDRKSDSSGAKYQLLMRPVHSAIADNSRLDQTLDLGSYRWEGGDRVQLLRRPPLVRLSALRPIQSVWLAPLLTRLGAIARQWESRDGRVADLADELLYRWPILSVRELAQRLVEMAQRVREPQDLAERIDMLNQPFGTHWPTSDELPARLIELIEGIAVAREQAGVLRVGHELLPLPSDHRTGTWKGRLALALTAGEIAVEWSPSLAAPSVVCLRVIQGSQTVFVNTIPAPAVFRIPALAAGTEIQVQSPVLRTDHPAEFTLRFRPCETC